MFDDILTAIPFGILLAFTIGPVFFVLLETSVTKGIASAIIFDLGVILADVVFILVIFKSTDTLLDKIKDDPKLLVFGGFLLIIYGLASFIKTSKSFRSIVREHYNVTTLKKNYTKLFIKGFLLNFINIGVLIGWFGFIVIGSSITTSKNGVSIFIITMLAAYFVTDLVKIVAAKRLKNKLTPKRIFKTKKIVALVILGFGILLLTQGLFPELYEKSKAQIEKVSPIN